MSSQRLSAADVAGGIGRRLARGAIWHGERCNWIGPSFAAAPGSLEMIEYQAALGASLYEGTSGIALFLAELHSLTGEPEARRAAMGAIRHALEASEARPAGSSLYAGSAGVAVAAARVGRTLGEEELTEAARGLAARLATGENGGDERAQHDLLQGSAGTILALLHLATFLDDATLVEGAQGLGGRLVDAAEENEHGLSWPDPASPATPNLTGFAHGAAGIGYALLELGHATGERSFSRAAERAFDYEQSTFNTSAGNWPDFREQVPPGPSGEPGSSAFWCHGGPGIALSRLAALERLGGERWRSEAEAGLRVANDAIERGLGRGGANYSLCHGLPGLAEIVAEGATALGGEWERSATVVDEVAARGESEYAGRDRWPCGAGSRESPGVMLGIAGIGYFYLRLAGARAASVVRPFR